jgi:hypothetical protein
MRAKTLWTARLPGRWTAPLLGLALLASACSKDVNYGYVDVDVTADEVTINTNRLYLVTSCEFVVMGADENGEPFGLPCRENNVSRHVGTFQWTSRATAGTLQFTVTLFDANHDPLGTGTSDPVPVSPGKHQATSVLVVGDDTPEPMPDAGTGGDAATDAAPMMDTGADDAAPGDAAVEQAGDGGTADTSADGAASGG